MEKVISGTLPWSSGECAHDGSVYEDLAAAIVLQAVKDYIKAVRRMWNTKLSVRTKRAVVIEMEELEEFFYSPWYDTLCNIDPGKLIHNCRLRAEEQEKEAIRKQNRKRIKEMQMQAEGGDHDETGKIITRSADRTETAE